MYHMIVRSKLRNAFAQLSRGNCEAVLKDLAPEFEHLFFGDHTFGGTRHTVSSFRNWLQRLFEVFPDLTFEVRNILVRGWPWDTVAAVEWIDRASTRDGVGYINNGVHIIRLRWVRVVELRAYHDTQRLADACRRQAQNGIPQAIAAQIVD